MIQPAKAGHRPWSPRRAPAIALLCCLTAPAQAVQIDYWTTNLPDTVPGEDLWRYDYRVSDGTFLAGQGFFVQFDYNLYADLGDPPPAVNGDWDPAVAQPSQILPDDGLYDALALVDNPSLLNLFSVEFIWSGGPAGPGAQPFTIYDAAFAPIETGTTRAAAPIPAPAALLAAGLLPLVRIRRRR